MNEFYDPQVDYIEHIKAATRYDSDGRTQAEAREWLDNYELAESLNSMGGCQLCTNLSDIKLENQQKHL